MICRYDLFLERFYPKILIQRKFYKHLGYKIDWDHPLDINEKINWLKIYSDTSLWTELADKYKVRSYVENKGLGYMLVPLLGKWDSVESIQWASLPDKFVMKINNGSGDILICNNKNDLNTFEWERRFKSLFSKPFGYVMGEPHYDAIKPCIIAEELLDHTQQDIQSTSLIDYKVWCFNGKPHSIWVCTNRTKERVFVASYDLDWNYHPEHSISTSHYILSTKLVPKPQCLDEILNAAKILSEGFPEVRVDFYVINNRPYFGEMTFSSNAGYMQFYTKEFLLELGNNINL